MFTKKEKLRADNDKNWDAYHDAREQIAKVDYIKKTIEHLKNIESIKEEKARKERRQLIQDYIDKNTPKEDATLAYADELGKPLLNFSCLRALEKLLGINPSF